MRRIDLFALFAKLPNEFENILKTPPEIVYLMGCRSFEQFCCTARALVYPGQFCPFCKVEMRRRRRERVEETDNWMLIQNEFPHKGTRKMLLIVPIEHVRRLEDLADGDWAEIGLLLKACNMRFNIEGGGVMWRFGDPRFNAGTVEHLHLNVVEPKPGWEYRPPFAKKEDEHIEDYVRFLGHLDLLNSKGGSKWLFSQESIEATQPKMAT